MSTEEYLPPPVTHEHPDEALPAPVDAGEGEPQQEGVATENTASESSTLLLRNIGETP